MKKRVNLDNIVTNEFFLDRELDRIKIRTKKDMTRSIIMKGVYAGIGVSVFIGGYVFLPHYHEYFDQIRYVVTNITNVFNF